VSVSAKPGAPVSVSATAPKSGVSTAKPAVSTAKVSVKSEDATSPIPAATNMFSGMSGGQEETPVFAVAAAAVTFIALAVQLLTMLG
jgi:hypothetical protein